jgi:hypothetical protein
MLDRVPTGTAFLTLTGRVPAYGHLQSVKDFINCFISSLGVFKCYIGPFAVRQECHQVLSNIFKCYTLLRVWPVEANTNIRTYTN